jgi:hypothetical protein
VIAWNYSEYELYWTPHRLSDLGVEKARHWICTGYCQAIRGNYEMSRTQWQRASQRWRRTLREKAGLDNAAKAQSADLHDIATTLSNEERQLNEIAKSLALMTPTVGDPKSSSIFRRTIDQPGELLSILSVAGILLYGLTWITYLTIYESFGLDLEEVGVGYATVLTHAAVGIVVLVIFGLLLVNIPFFMESDARDIAALWIKEDEPSYMKLAKLYGVGALLVVWLLIIWLLYLGVSRFTKKAIDGPISSITISWVQTTLKAIIPSVVFILLAIILAGILGSLIKYIASPVLTFVRELGSTNTLGLRVFLLLVMIASLLVAPYLLGSRIAGQIQAGNTTGFIDTLPIRLFFNIQAEGVEVTWTQGEILCRLPKNASIMYLGKSQGVTILYDSQTGKVCRVPSQLVALRSPID